MKKFKDIILNTDRKPCFLDLNNALYRAYYVYTPDRFKSNKGLPNGHLLGLTQTIRTLDKLKYEVFICEDSNCTFRKTLNEDYKSQRTDSSIKFYLDYPKIRDLISNLDHVHTLHSKGYESDDVMYSASKICSNLGIDNYIISKDKDLLQACDKYTSIVHKVTLNEFVTVDSESDYYKNLFPVSPDRLSIYRALKGDVSDNLKPPVARLPKDFVVDVTNFLFENNGSLINYKPKKKTHIKWLKQLVNNWNLFLSNYKIMNLDVIPFETLNKSKKDSYKQICNDYDLLQFYNYVYQLDNNIVL